MDKLLKKANLSLVVGTSSWREQFIEAITVSAGKLGVIQTKILFNVYISIDLNYIFLSFKDQHLNHLY